MSKTIENKQQLNYLIQELNRLACEIEDLTQDNKVMNHLGNAINRLNILTK